MVTADTTQSTGAYLQKETPGAGTGGRSLARMRLVPGQWGVCPPGAERAGRSVMKLRTAEHTRGHKSFNKLPEEG